MSSVSAAQAAKIGEWLSEHGFERTDPSQPERETGQQLWRGDDVDVRLLAREPPVWLRRALKRRSRRVRVKVRPRDGRTDWLSLDESLARHGGLSSAMTISPIELATSFPSRGGVERSSWRGFRHAPGAWLYRTSKRPAYGIKVALQMAVGLGAIGDLGRQIVYTINQHHEGQPFTPAAKESVVIIAGALAIAAAIELAYTLYTPGPDEALNPLMLGLASGILLVVTKETTTLITQFIAVLLGVLALGLLFIVRLYFVEEEDE
jgi:hypothetical protein